MSKARIVTVTKTLAHGKDLIDDDPKGDTLLVPVEMIDWIGAQHFGGKVCQACGGSGEVVDYDKQPVVAGPCTDCHMRGWVLKGGE